MMKNLWTVFRFELQLSWRGPGRWLIALIVALLGVEISILANRVNGFWWLDLCAYLGLLTLLLALTTGNQVNRDRELRLDGVVLSTPLATNTYVFGKYLAGLFSLLVYGVIAFLTFLVTSFLLTGEDYYTPAIGTGVYIQAWLLLVLTPLLFAQSLTLAGFTLARGQRALVSILVVLIWGVPYVIDVPKILSISFMSRQSFDSDFIDSATRFAFQENANDPGVEHQLVHLFQTVVIPEHLSANFLVSRAFFLGLSILLVIGAIFVVKYQRQGRL